MLRIFFKYRNMCVTEKTSERRIRFERNPIEIPVSGCNTESKDTQAFCTFHAEGAHTDYPETDKRCLSTSRTAPLVFSFFFIAAFLWHPSANILRFSRHPPDLLRTFKIICFVYLTPSSRGTFQRTYFHCFPGTSVFLFPCGLIFSPAAVIIRTFRCPLSSFRLFFSHPLCFTTPSTRIFFDLRPPSSSRFFPSSFRCPSIRMLRL